MANLKEAPDPVREMLRQFGLSDDLIQLLMGDITPAQGRREGDRLYREHDPVVHFARAREEITKRSLSKIDHRQPPNDRPDVLAVCSHWGEVGIEVADVRPNMSEEELEQRRAKGEEPLSAEEACKLMQSWIVTKNAKRQQEGWTLPDRSILLLRVFQDIRLVLRALKATAHAAFVPPHGFVEIWLQDGILV